MSRTDEAKREAARAVSGDEPKTERQTTLRCTASGCPLQWSSDMGRGKLCSWHDSAPRLDWAEITDDIMRIVGRGESPVYPQIAQAKWVTDAARRARSGPKGETLAAAMRVRDSLSERELAAQKRNTQLMVDSLATRVDRR